MVGSVLAISLLGLGAVQALPANLQDRQSIIIGGPSNGGAISPGAPVGSLPACNPDIPPEAQEACLYTPISGEMKPSPKKRQPNLVSRGSSNLVALQAAYEDVIVFLGDNQPSLADATALSEAQDMLSAAGVSFTPISFSSGSDAGSVILTPRQEDWFRIGGCSDSNIRKLWEDYFDYKAALSKAGIGSIEYLMAVFYYTLTKARLEACGYTTSVGPMIPVPTVPGGAINPVPTSYPGGAINPVPTSYPGGRIQPVPTITGGRIEPVPTSIGGGWLEPVPTVPGGSMNPTKRSIEKKSPDGEIEPVGSTPGGTIEPVPSIPGGWLQPAPVIPGGKIKPATRSTEEPRDIVAPLDDGFLRLGKPQAGKIVPVPVIPGGKLTPVPTVPGGRIRPATRSTEEPRDLVVGLKDGIVRLGNPQVGKIVPVKPIPGGKIVPVPTTPGGKIRPATRDGVFLIGEPEVGKIVPVPTIPGGKIKPATRSTKDDTFLIGKPQVGKIVPVPAIPGGKIVPVPATPGGKIRPATRDDLFLIGEPEVGRIVPVPTIPGGKMRPT